MHDLSSTDAAWRRMEPVIDDALQELGRVDRDAILIRYVEGRGMRESRGAPGRHRGCGQEAVAREFVNSRRDINLDVRNDGSFVSVERVPAGDYRLWAAFKNASTHQKVTVSEEQEALAELDIGVIELRGRNR